MGNNGNPLGAVQIWDGNQPRTITAYAGSAISGGQCCYISGTASVVSSGADSYVTSDLVATLGASGGWFVGIALHNASSGTPVTLATEGCFIVEAQGTVIASNPVAPNGNNGFVPCYLGSQHDRCGRALTGAGSEGYFIIKLNA